MNERKEHIPPPHPNCSECSRHGRNEVETTTESMDSNCPCTGRGSVGCRLRQEEAACSPAGSACAATSAMQTTRPQPKRAYLVIRIWTDYTKWGGVPSYRIKSVWHLILLGSWC